MKSKNNRLLIRWLIVCAAMHLSVEKGFAQEVWEEEAEQGLADEGLAPLPLDAYFDDLAELREHPLNLNEATREQLERFPFLSDRQVENLLYYVYRYGPLLTLDELSLVEEMDRQTMLYLRPYVCVRPLSKERYPLRLKNVLKYGHHEGLVRVDVPFYTRDGYRKGSPEEESANPNRFYLGGSWYHQWRYSFRYRDQMYAGITAEKDAGEPFFAGRNRKGYDYYSPYLFVRDWGRWKALALGNYRLSYGCGLVLNTGFGMGKRAMLASLGPRSQGIRKHSSTDEFHYFQGFAASYQLAKRWTWDAFFSYRRMDGTVKDQLITSLKTDGYHRLPREFDKRNKLSNMLVGSHLTYNGKFCELGLTTVYHVFNRVLKPEKRSYNRFYPQGKDFYQVGMDYRFFWKRFQLLGETAVDKQGAVVTLNRLTYAPHGGILWTLMHRWYDVKYQSLYARSIGENSQVQNETGVYLGVETPLGRSFKLIGYGDYFYFPWKRYRVSRSGTQGWEGFLQGSYSPTSSLTMFVRYRYKQYERDRTADGGRKQTLPYLQHRCRYQLDYAQADRLVLKTVVEYVTTGYRGCSASRGMLVAQSGGYQLPSFPLRVDVSEAWFHTDDYASRISLYEKSVLYAFSMPSLYDQGLRSSFNLRCEWGRHLVLQAKYGWTHYFHRTSIGTGLDRITGSNKSDLSVQLRVKF